MQPGVRADLLLGVYRECICYRRELCIFAQHMTVDLAGPCIGACVFSKYQVKVIPGNNLYCPMLIECCFWVGLYWLFEITIMSVGHGWK